MSEVALHHPSRIPGVLPTDQAYGATPHQVPQRARANMARIRQSRPDAGLGFQLKFRKTPEIVPSSLGSSASASECVLPLPSRR